MSVDVNYTGRHSIYTEARLTGVRVNILEDTKKTGKYVDLSRRDAFVTAIKMIWIACFG